MSMQQTFKLGSVAMVVLLASGCSSLAKISMPGGDSGVNKKYNFGYQVYNPSTQSKIGAQAFDDGASTYIVPPKGYEFAQARTPDGQPGDARQDGTYLVVSGVRDAWIITGSSGATLCVTKTSAEACRAAPRQTPMYPIPSYTQANTATVPSVPLSQPVMSDTSSPSQPLQGSSASHVSSVTTSTGKVITAARVTDMDGSALPQDGHVSVATTSSGATVTATRLVENSETVRPIEVREDTQAEKPVEFKAIFIDGSEQESKGKEFKLQKASYSSMPQRKEKTGASKAVGQAKASLSPDQKAAISKQMGILNEKLLELQKRLGEFDI